MGWKDDLFPDLLEGVDGTYLVAHFPIVLVVVQSPSSPEEIRLRLIRRAVVDSAHLLEVGVVQVRLTSLEGLRGHKLLLASRIRSSVTARSLRLSLFLSYWSRGIGRSFFLEPFQGIVGLQSQRLSEELLIEIFLQRKANH